MDPSSLAQEIAQCLGLMDDSFPSLVPLAVQHIELLDRGELGVPQNLSSFNQRYGHFRELVKPLDNCSIHDSPKREVTTSFASRHLPSLAGALLLLPPSKLAKSPWYCILVSIGPNHPLYALFIRTHEDGARLQLALMEAFAATIPSLTSFKTFDDHADKWLSLGAFCLGGLVHLFPNRLAGQPFSWTSSTEHLAIQFEKTSRDLQLLLKNGGHQSAEVLIELMNAQRAVHLLSFACSSDGFKNPLLPSLLRLVRTLVPWADCEGLNLNATACVKSSEGMLTCSRCQAVKYCSVGHQKADWKKHKPLCLAPAWK